MRRRDEDLGFVDFQAFETGRRLNVFVVLPPNFESTVEADEESPVFDVTPARLMSAFRDIAIAQPRTTLTASGGHGNQIVLCQRTGVVRYPDYITVEAVSAGKGRSALCIFSRSKYGIRDFGMNGKRVRKWVSLVERRLGRKR